MGAPARQDAARLLGETYQGDSESARQAFRTDPAMQERYFAAYTRANHQYLMSGSREYRGLTKEGKLQVLGYAHNAGWSRAAEWLAGGMSKSFRDGFNTRSDKYSKAIRAAQEKRRNPEPVTPPAAPAPQSQSARDAFIPPPRKKASNMIMPGAMNIASAPRRPRLDIAPENVSAETGNPSYTHHSSTYYDPSTLSSLVAVG
jgi:hypothetical protein